MEKKYIFNFNQYSAVPKFYITYNPIKMADLPVQLIHSPYSTSSKILCVVAWYFIQPYFCIVLPFIKRSAYACGKKFVTKDN